jgi:7-cyano-7-deazaguanine synthase
MTEGEPRRAVALLSGGLDSSVALAMAIHAGYEVHALTVDYGQRHNREVNAARAVAKHYGLDHKVVRIDLSAFGGSSLTDVTTPIPTDTPIEKIGSGVPSTYVPGRNTVFLATAMAWAEVLDADAVFIGANAVDYSGYPDCRPEYIEAMQRVVELGTRRGAEGEPMRIVAPILREAKAGIVRRGVELDVPFEHTWSCYKGRPEACGVCDSCQLRLRGFAEAGVTDPIPYEAGAERPDSEATEVATLDLDLGYEEEEAPEDDVRRGEGGRGGT